MSKIDTKKIVDSLECMNAKITMFADGFVDEVLEIVKSRNDSNDFTLYSHMKQFSERISKQWHGRRRS